MIPQAWLEDEVAGFLRTVWRTSGDKAFFDDLLMQLGHLYYNILMYHPLECVIDAGANYPRLSDKTEQLRASLHQSVPHHLRRQPTGRNRMWYTFGCAVFITRGNPWTDSRERFTSL
jgi:hypothetical protein